VPDDVGARTLETYRAVAAEGIPHVTADAFDADVEAARVCWALVTVSWWLLRVLEADPVQGPGAPLARPRTQHRLALVAQSRTSAAAFAGEVLEHTRERWGDLALELAPAYR
jgi:hypothetical protein